MIRLLTRVGDLPEGAVPSDSGTYTAALAAAVKRFQARHGLAPDGRLGKGTLAQLNIPLRVRVRQLELALERWQRLHIDPSRPVILMNLPEFQLRAYGASHQPELSMKIVIGRRKLKTPLLSSQLDAVVFHPYWNVPFSIQRQELVRDVQRDPAYISKNGFQLVNAKNAVAKEPDSKTLLAELRSGKLRLRQKPGPKNALGRVKFLFPNPYDIYLHDTPETSLFAKERRDLSHGCIRLEKADLLAEWVLGQESGWPRDRVEKALQGTDTFQVKLAHPIPVVTMYVTATVLENGEVHFFDDIYGEDAALEKELAGSEAQPTSGEPGPHPHE